MQALIYQHLTFPNVITRGSVSVTGADAPPRTPSPKGGVGVEPIASSAPNGAPNLINQSGRRKAWAARYEREMCVYLLTGSPT